MNKQTGRVNVAADSNTELSIEAIAADADLAKLAAEAAFMEEKVTVEISPPSSDADVRVVILNVNGVNQPVMRGVPQPIRRKYLEVLARLKQTSYSQLPTNYIEPEISNELRPHTGLVYPFQVIEDPNPEGRAWLRKILAEAA